MKGRITKAEVVPLLLRACPAAQPKWDEHLAQWQGEDAGAFNDVSVFAHHMVDSHLRGDMSECPALFATIEHIVENGDLEAKELAMFGVLEDIQTLSANQGLEFHSFARWLGPNSRTAWAHIEALWRAGGGSLAGVIQVERGRRHHRKWWEFWKPR